MRTTRPRLVFTLGVLLGINAMNFYDRQVLPAVQEKIRLDWEMSDSQLGWLGTAFILLYAVVGLPLGRLTDVWQRRWILSIGVGLWSVLTLASGLAWNFTSLFVLRLGVGVGEASCAPAASSLIGDLVPAERRARALSIFMLGLPLGLGLSFLVSGAIAERQSWREAFYVAAIPGLLLAVAALFISDPRAQVVPGSASASQAPASLPSFGAVARLVLSLPTMWWIIASGALHNFNSYALGTFLSSFVKRYHGVTVEQAGQVSGLIYGFGALGIFAGGWLGDRAFQRDVSGRLHVAWIALAASIPLLLLALAAPRGELLLCALWLLPAILLLYVYYGTVYAAIQDIIEPSLRGMAMAIYFCAMYFLGAVLGPVATGWVSDLCAHRIALMQGALKVTESHRALGLHDAMYLVPALNVALVLVLFAAARTVKHDYRRLQERMAADPRDLPGAPAPADDGSESPQPRGGH